MTINLRRSRKKEWHVSIRDDGDIIFVEVHSGDKLHDLEVVEMLFQDCQAVILSQYIDRRAWDIGNKDLFISELVKKYPVEIKLATDYTNFLEPDKASSRFVLNIFGKLDSKFLYQTTNFGTSSLSCILYGITQQPTNWTEELLKWNTLILDWFDLKLKNEDLVDFIEVNKYLVVNIDGHLFFCFTQIAYFNQLLKIIRQISSQYDYMIDLRLRPINQDKLISMIST